MSGSRKKKTKMEWWEMLDWNTMPRTFKMLPEELKEKIKKAGLIEEASK